MALPQYTPSALEQRGRSRIGALPRRLGIRPEDLTGKRLLEVGCGFAESTAAAREIGIDAIGIDPWPRWHKRQYAHLANDGVLLKADMSSPEILELGQFDFVHSYTVFEHIERPYDALQNIFKILKPGGRAYLYFNLYRGASAAHLMRYLDFPWIHLVCSEEEIRQMMREKHGMDRGPSWVNKLTHLHYFSYATEIGFSIRSYWYNRRKMTDEFFEQYRDKLKAYPRSDLNKNFMHMVLEV